MKKTVFEFSSYKTYLREILKNKPGHGHGFRARIAEAVACQPSYVSQVLNKHVNFSLEQAEALNELLGHASDESDFFLLLVQLERAGSPALQKRLQSQIELLIERRMAIKNRVDIRKSLSPADQATYYSHWIFSAIHIANTIPELNTKEKIAEHLGISLEKINESLDFLLRAGILREEKGALSPGFTRVFLGNDSPMLQRHHVNWRLRAIESLDRAAVGDIHFSSVVSLSRTHVKELREKFLREIEEARNVVRESKEEELYAWNVDFYDLALRHSR